ncbi:MAG: type II toxin-antitoxin system VapC family toxin [Acidobacteria bacterium]|nr:type II toxin-antitoxin system VapC family toxin [Acidobacteriota bacterium]
MYLLDTDTVVFLLRGNEPVRRNLELHRLAPIRISAVTLMELYYGAFKSGRPEANVARVHAVERAAEILPIEREAAEVFGMLKASLEKAGTPLDDFDLAIAACALTNKLVLVTHNTRHFQRVTGLVLEDWTQAGG